MFRFPINMPDPMIIGCGEKSLNAKRCDDIEEQLAEHRLYANVSRHTLFDKAMYIVSFDKDNGGGEFPSVGKIADALDIPSRWVNLYECSATDTQYAVLEKELNGKYKNSDGRLEWVEPFDFFEAVNSGKIKKYSEAWYEMTAAIQEVELMNFLNLLAQAGSEARVFVFGSVFGGTGASSIPVIPTALKEAVDICGQNTLDLSKVKFPDKSV